MDIDKWCPYLETLTDAEMEKKLRDQDRNTRLVFFVYITVFELIQSGKLRLKTRENCQDKFRIYKLIEFMSNFRI